MRKHSPWGPKPLALERTLLKLRAMEMVLILYYIEDLKREVLSAVQHTDSLVSHRGGVEPVPKGTSKAYKKAWAALVEDGVISAEESKEIQGFIDYRNTIAHAMHGVTGDIGTDPVVMEIVERTGSRYNAEALDRIRHLREKVFGRLWKEYVITLRMDGLLFSTAQRTYEDELARLKRRVRVLAKRRNAEISLANTQLHSISPADWRDLDIKHYEFRKANGNLTEKGIVFFTRLAELGLGELPLAHAMRMSLRSVRKRLRTMIDIEQGPRKGGLPK